MHSPKIPLWGKGRVLYTFMNGIKFCHSIIVFCTLYQSRTGSRAYRFPIGFVGLFQPWTSKAPICRFVPAVDLQGSSYWSASVVGPLSFHRRSASDFKSLYRSSQALTSVFPGLRGSPLFLIFSRITGDQVCRRSSFLKQQVASSYSDVILWPTSLTPLVVYISSHSSKPTIKPGVADRKPCVWRYCRACP